jgi:hypothetical protein
MASENTSAKIIYQECQSEFDRQIGAVRTINDKSITVIQFNLVVCAFVVSAFTFISDVSSSIQVANTVLFVFSGGISFVYAIWSCAISYSSVRLARGMNVDQKWAYILDEKPERYYREFSFYYPRAINENEKIIGTQVEHFQRGLWATFLGLLLITFSLIKFILPPYPLSFDLFPILILCVIAMLGKCISSEGEYGTSDDCNG